MKSPYIITIFVTTIMFACNSDAGSNNDSQCISVTEYDSTYIRSSVPMGDILDVAEEVLDLHLSKAAKRSKIEYIGMIVCEVSNSNNKKLGKIVDALNRILNNEKDMSDFKKARKEPDFSWNETIAKLGGYYGETNE